MSETRILRWGILGAARIALRHVLPAFGWAPHAHAAAIAARDPQRARAAAEKFDIGRASGLSQRYSNKISWLAG